MCDIYDIRMILTEGFLAGCTLHARFDSLCLTLKCHCKQRSQQLLSGTMFPAENISVGYLIHFHCILKMGDNVFMSRYIFESLHTYHLLTESTSRRPQSSSANRSCQENICSPDTIFYAVVRTSM